MKNISSLFWTGFGLVIFYHPSVYPRFIFAEQWPEPVFSPNIYPVIIGFAEFFIVT